MAGKAGAVEGKAVALKDHPTWPCEILPIDVGRSFRAAGVKMGAI